MDLTSIGYKKGIIWDWNGTLLDDVDLAVDCMNRMLSKRALPVLKIGRYKEVFTFPVRDYYLSVGFDFDREPFEIPALEFIEQYNLMVWDCPLHANALKVLNHFKERGIRQYVLSAMQQDTLDQCLNYYQIAPYFEHVSGLDDHFAHSKLDSGRWLLGQIDLDPSDLFLVGDTLHDFEVASELGVDAVLVSKGHQSHERLTTCGVPVLDDLSRLMIG